MADILTPMQRSTLMARIHSAGNASTELRLVALLRTAGISGWRRGVRIQFRVSRSGFRDGETKQNSPQSSQRAQRKDRGGQGGSNSATSVSSVVQIRRPETVKPDFVFRAKRLAVFVDGCFWHGCPLHHTRPKTRRAFWDAKITANRARDRRLDRALRAAGWRVLHLWEHALEPRQLGRTLARVKKQVTRNRQQGASDGRRNEVLGELRYTGDRPSARITWGGFRGPALQPGR